jgi:hypothetical protein
MANFAARVDLEDTPTNYHQMIRIQLAVYPDFILIKWLSFLGRQHE